VSIERLARNYLKMTPGSLAGGAKASTPVRSNVIGALRRAPAGTFGGESRTATPVGCNRPVARITDRTGVGPVAGVAHAGVATAIGTAYDADAVPGRQVFPAAAAAVGTAYSPILPQGLSELIALEYTYVELDLLPDPAMEADEYTYVEKLTTGEAGAGFAPGTGTAHDATVTTSGGSAAAGLASGTGTAHNATAAVAAPVGVAAGTGTAYNATVVAGAAAAGVATGTGTAYSATITIGGSAGLAASTGTAYNATVSTGGDADVMITEDGDTMITEDGDTMILEGP